MLTPPNAIEAILFISGEAMEKKELATLLGINEEDLKIALLALAKTLEGRGLSLIDNEKEVELRTSPAAAPILKKLRERELSRDLGKAGLETLAVIAYRSGATRSEIDWVRGVNSSTSVRTLLLRGLVAGEEDSKDRRRTCYRLTTDALAHLGVSTLEKLPRYNELSKGAAEIALTEGQKV
ncbi:MAG: SMC-Scp complex subunit ScpB [bacterium]|nr:SMC-Scp complex subunit ScpB [bacterium]